MLSLLRRKPSPLAPVERITRIEPEVSEPVKRGKQQNIKASEDCCATFAALARAQGMSRSVLFEDMVAERLEMLQRQGIVVRID